MEVCYRCGRRVYSPDRCPRCGLTFCEEHLPTGKHGCLVVAEEEGARRSRLFSVLELAGFIALLIVVWWLVNHR